MPEGFNSDVIRYCEISKKLTSWTEKAPICKGTVNHCHVVGASAETVPNISLVRNVIIPIKQQRSFCYVTKYCTFSVL